jgi:hypothetical protein
VKFPRATYHFGKIFFNGDIAMTLRGFLGLIFICAGSVSLIILYYFYGLPYHGTLIYVPFDIVFLYTLAIAMFLIGLDLARWDFQQTKHGGIEAPGAKKSFLSRLKFW